MRKKIRYLTFLIACSIIGGIFLNSLKVETCGEPPHEVFAEKEEIAEIVNENVMVETVKQPELTAEAVVTEEKKEDVKKEEKEEKDEDVAEDCNEFIVPLKGRLTSEFGPRWGKTHGGIDIAAKKGTNIVASDDGKVIFTGEMGSYGLLVKIEHSNGYITYYAHCSKIKVNKGDIVKKGDVIALVGSTGNSTGPHCHFEIRHNDKKMNPLDYIKL